MDIQPTVLDTLRERVKATLSAGRYAHTLGVERAACTLGERLLPEAIPELRAAALLHDITKEYTEQAHQSLALAFGMSLPGEMRGMRALLHSFTAPLWIKKEYPALASERILSAVACHTAGKADMTVFDKILFIADYIEDGRTYPSCVSVRERLYAALAREDEDPHLALDEAVLAALDHTIGALLSRGSRICVQTVLARNALIGSIFRD